MRSDLKKELLQRIPGPGELLSEIGRDLIRFVIELLQETGAITIFYFTAWRHFFTPPYYLHQVIKSMYIVGVSCLLPVVLTVGPLGAAISLQSLAIVRDFGADALLSSLLGHAMLRELSPLISCLIIAAQIGSSFAGELGTMRLREEFDALEVMGIDPFQYSVNPRFVALFIMAPVMNAIAVGAGIFGGWVIAVPFGGITGGTFFSNLSFFAELGDILAGIIKTMVFGTIIATVSTYKGYTASGGVEGIGRAANTAVVQSIIYLVVANYFMSSAMFINL